MVVAIALGLMLAVGVATIGVISSRAQQQQQEAVEQARQEQREGPLAIPPVPASEADGPECARVLDALPRELIINGSPVPRRELAQPAPSATAAWGDAHHDPVTVRCGMDAPAELTRTSGLVTISGVDWLEITEGDKTSWLAVDRPVYVALTVPQGSGSGPVQDLAGVLDETLPKQPVFPR